MNISEQSEFKRSEYEDIIEIPINVFNIINTDTKITILHTMDYKDVVYLCSSWKDINNFCHIHSERIWKGMIKRDFDMIINNIQNYLKIYKDLMVAEEYYKKYKNDSIWQLIGDKDENYFGVKWLIDIEKVDPSDWTIRAASYRNQVGVVKLLLEDRRVDPSDHYNEAIQMASANGHIEVVKLLLQDPRVDPSDKNNRAIRMAFLKGHIYIIKLLLKDPRVRNSSSGEAFEKYFLDGTNFFTINDFFSDKNVA